MRQRTDWSNINPWIAIGQLNGNISYEAAEGLEFECGGTMYRPEVYLKSILHTKDKMKSIRVQIVSQLISAMSMLSCGFYSRAFILFLTGTSLATLKFFQYLGTDSHIGRSLELTSKLYCGWWIPVMAGVFACIIGLLYPCVDSKVGEPHYFRRDWTSVVRCVAVFVGINHFSSVSLTSRFITLNNLCGGFVLCPRTCAAAGSFD